MSPELALIALNEGLRAIAARRAAALRRCAEIEAQFPRYDDAPNEIIAEHAACCREIHRLRESPAGYFRIVDGVAL